MEIEVIPNTNLYEKDVKKFKIIRKDSDENPCLFKIADLYLRLGH